MVVVGWLGWVVWAGWVEMGAAAGPVGAASCRCRCSPAGPLSRTCSRSVRRQRPAVGARHASTQTICLIMGHHDWGCAPAPDRPPRTQTPRTQTFPHAGCDWLWECNWLTVGPTTARETYVKRDELDARSHTEVGAGAVPVVVPACVQRPVAKGGRVVQRQRCCASTAGRKVAHTKGQLSAAWHVQHRPLLPSSLSRLPPSLPPSSTALTTRVCPSAYAVSTWTGS
jgi:hypothetical protein